MAVSEGVRGLKFHSKFDSRASPMTVSEGVRGLKSFIASLTVELCLWQSQGESEV